MPDIEFKILVRPEFFGINPIKEIRSSFRNASKENFGGLMFSASKIVISSRMRVGSTNLPNDFNNLNRAASFGARPVRCNRKPLARILPHSSPDKNTAWRSFFSVLSWNVLTAWMALK